MSRYIDVEGLINSGWHLEKTGEANALITRMSLADLPTADVVEVKHGEWIPCELKDGRDMANLGYLKCSQCGDFGFLSENNWGDWTGQTVTTYCPTCGAHMRNG